MTIPFLDLQKQYKQIKSEVDTAIMRVVASQVFVMGNETLAFEEEFAKYLGAKHAVGVNSGTDGLIIALRALNIGPGDEVITPANSFIATTLAIVEVGATPVFTDIDPLTYQISVDDVIKKITKKTKAVLPVHLYGAACDITELQKIIKEHSLYLVEDAAQAHGTMIGSKKAGTIGELGIFSFYPGKNLGAYGDGGAVVTNDTALFEKLKKLRNYGQVKKYFHEEFGLNSRLDEIQAAVLRVKLRYLDIWNKKRNNVADTYRQGLSHSPTQKILDNTTSNYHLFVIENDNRDDLMQALAQKGIQTLIHYPVPIHLQRCFSYMGFQPGSFPHAEAAAKRILSLPMYAELSEEQQQYIIKNLNILSST